MVMAALAEKKEVDNLLFIIKINEVVASLLSGQSSLAVELVKGMFDTMPTYEPNTGAIYYYRNTSVLAY